MIFEVRAHESLDWDNPTTPDVPPPSRKSSCLWKGLKRGEEAGGRQRRGFLGSAGPTGHTALPHLQTWWGAKSPSQQVQPVRGPVLPMSLPGLPRGSVPSTRTPELRHQARGQGPCRDLHDVCWGFGDGFSLCLLGGDHGGQDVSRWRPTVHNEHDKRM